MMLLGVLQQKVRLEEACTVHGDEMAQSGKAVVKLEYFFSITLVVLVFFYFHKKKILPCT